MTSGPISLHPLFFPLYVFFANWLLVCWLIGMCWTWIDSRRRLGRTVGRIALAMLGVVPIAGPLLYVLLRPNELLIRRRERARMKDALERLAAARPQAAPAIGSPVQADAPAARYEPARVSPPHPAPATLGRSRSDSAIAHAGGTSRR